jgi:hypothetical protein
MAEQVFGIRDCGKNGRTQLSGKDGEGKLLPLFELIKPDVVKGLANLLRLGRTRNSVDSLVAIGRDS